MLIFVIHAPFRDAFTQFFDPLGNAGFTLLGAIAYTLSVFGAAVGVGALKSATKSDIVKSISCPTALITGILNNTN